MLNPRYFAASRPTGGEGGVNIWLIVIVIALVIGGIVWWLR
jgi:hypothetical protein